MKSKESHLINHECLITPEKRFYLRFEMIPVMIHSELCEDFGSVCPKEVSQKGTLQFSIGAAKVIN